MKPARSTMSVLKPQHHPETARVCAPSVQKHDPVHNNR